MTYAMQDWSSLYRMAWAVADEAKILRQNLWKRIQTIDLSIEALQADWERAEFTQLSAAIKQRRQEIGQRLESLDAVIDSTERDIKEYLEARQAKDVSLASKFFDLA